MVMAAFWAICALLILVALAFVLPPLLRRGGVPDPRRVALQQAHRSGVLDAGEYAAKLAALGDAAAAPTSLPPAARNAAIAIIALLPLLAIGLYQKLGDPRVFDPAVQSVSAAMQDAQRAGLPPMDQAIAGLAERLAREPDDAQGWLLLGRAREPLLDEASSLLKPSRWPTKSRKLCCEMPPARSIAHDRATWHSVVSTSSMNLAVSTSST